MKGKNVLIACALLLASHCPIEAHCQMPCGIYHDDIVFDLIDQYIETMYKGITVINGNKWATVRDKNEAIRWICTKEKSSDEIAELILTYFLQQKIKPGEEKTAKSLESAHKLLFLLVQMKQNVDLDILHEFSHEWDSFKVMFHREGYECEMEKIKQKQWDEARLKAQGKSKSDDKS